MKTATKKDFKSGVTLRDDQGNYCTLLNRRRNGDWNAKRVLRDNTIIPVRMAKFYTVVK